MVIVTHQHLIPELDRKGLREFGLTSGAIVAVIFGLFFPWLLELGLVWWPWILFGVLSLMALAVPMTLQPVYRIWMRFGLMMSKITTPIIMGAVFYLIITPTGLVMKVFSKDPLRRKLVDKESSYRVPSHKPERERIERPL